MPFFFGGAVPALAGAGFVEFYLKIHEKKKTHLKFVEFEVAGRANKVDGL